MLHRKKGEPFEVIPTSLYIHFPWCIKKCPYCDFNSHVLGSSNDDRNTDLYSLYIDSLLEDFRLKYAQHKHPIINSIFIGGGTPSLIPGKEIKRLLTGIGLVSILKMNCEITIEANPGAFDKAQFSEYLNAGVNRLSIGVQSFSDLQLKQLGRVHTSIQASKAINHAKDLGFNNVNLDLMYGLPDQTLISAIDDLERALEFNTQHLSVYQLTIEPNTLFNIKKPTGLPNNDYSYDLQQSIIERLTKEKFKQYEVSAYTNDDISSNDFRSCHNLNYWQFGDYIAIGSGAHGKMTSIDPETGTTIIINRYMNYRKPAQFINVSEKNKSYKEMKVNPYISFEERIKNTDKIRLEFLMNALRIKQGFQINGFEQRTNESVQSLLNFFKSKNINDFFIQKAGNIALTDIAYDHLDSVLSKCIT